VSKENDHRMALRDTE